MVFCNVYHDICNVQAIPILIESTDACYIIVITGNWSSWLGRLEVVGFRVRVRTEGLVYRISSSSGSSAVL